MVQTPSQLRDLPAQPINDLGLANVRTIFSCREIRTFGLQAANNASVAGDRAIALNKPAEHRMLAAIVRIS